MNGRDDELRLADIASAINAINRHLSRGTIDDELVFDACRARLIEIGEAVKAIDSDLLDRAPDIPWREIAKMRDRLTHHYFDTQREIVADTVTRELPQLRQAVQTLRGYLSQAVAGQTSLDQIAARSAARPVLDPRTPDEILGYDSDGLPS